jgi:nucleoside-diphosphate-sugar epimerase
MQSSAEVNGTLDIMRACAKAKSVRRVIYTFSVSAAFPLNDNGEFRAAMTNPAGPWSISSGVKSLFSL